MKVNYIKELLAQGKLKDGLKELGAVAAKSNETDFENGIILLKGRFFNLEREQLLGINSNEIEKKELAKINHVALNYLKEYEEHINYATQKKETQKTNIKSHSTNTRSNEKVLFIGANPPDTSRIEIAQEISKIQEQLQMAGHRDSIELEQFWAVQPQSLMQSLMDEKPSIVHFSGHGTETGIIVYKDEDTRHEIPNNGLVNLFKLVDSVNCVILNCCYSEALATELNKIPHITCVIGMSSAVPDLAAISFSTGFYKALGNGKTYSEAFEFGKVLIQLEGIQGDTIPVVKTS